MSTEVEFVAKTSGASLGEIVEAIRTEFTEISTTRDSALIQSRSLVRSCANAIRSIHRHEWSEAESMLQMARKDAQAMVGPLIGRPALYHAGYTQDALKELVEACVLFAVSHNQPWPQAQELQVTGATYLRGLCEAASETRRFVLDLIRRGQVQAAEPYLDFMDEVYSLLLTVDFPDAVTDGLRRSTDALRGVLERTRGDLTLAIRQDQMRAALYEFGARLDARPGPGLAESVEGLAESDSSESDES